MRDLNLLRVFVAVAEEASFRAAADRLGVTRSAVSQGIRKLEDSCGISLVNRTTRSVHLTEAGEKLFSEIRAPLQDIDGALENVSSIQAPKGKLRIVVTSIAECFLSGPTIACFSERYPDIELDVTVTDDEFDIVAGGFDAGIRLGELIEQDMIAVPISPPQREVVVGTPAYLSLHGTPRHPRDLIDHRCIGWRPSPEVEPYRWEFAEKGEPFEIAVQPQVTTNDLRLMIRTVLADGGLTFANEDTFKSYIDRGDLVPLLLDYLPSFPGFQLFFPSRRNMAPKLRALVDFMKSSPAKTTV